jgi:hypothetical protein
MAYYSLDPWGPERADLNHAITSAMVANTARDSRKSQPVSPGDLMPKYGQSPEGEGMPSPEKMKAQLLGTFGHMIKPRKPKEGGDG